MSKKTAVILCVILFTAGTFISLYGGAYRLNALNEVGNLLVISSVVLLIVRLVSSGRRRQGGKACRPSGKIKQHKASDAVSISIPEPDGGSGSFNRKISWSSSSMDKEEMRSAYERIIERGYAGLLEKMELNSLLEALSAAQKLPQNRVGGKNTLTWGVYCALPEEERERLVCDFGILSLNGISDESIYHQVVLTGKMIEFVPACAMFQLLERFEKLDGIYDPLLTEENPRVVFELCVPSGTSKFIEKYVGMMMSVYPWAEIWLIYVDSSELPDRVDNIDVE